MKIFLIRHGQTTGDIEDRYGGEYDDNLTDKGIMQSKKLANLLKDKGIEIIFHSPKKRAVQTAKIIGDILKAQYKAVDGIRERNCYGILSGLTKQEAKDKFPEEVAKLTTYFGHNVTDSEDYDSFKQRIIKNFDQLFSVNYKTISIVTHGGPIMCFVREVLKSGDFEYLGDCAYLELEKRENSISIIKLWNSKLKN
ncbi:histidine phosphatase family protein [Candidatus Woesearchaeota archaeon]|nr:histidine phosphatase family protein [Candidatus Woesearchaeota archaeon]